MPYSTGLFSFFDDLPVLLYGVGCGGCLAVHNGVIAADNQAAFGLPGDMINEKCEFAGMPCSLPCSASCLQHVASICTVSVV